jgi:ATP-dependent protease ClpP protease subunit
MDTKNKWFDMSRPQNAEGESSTEAEISIYDQIGGWGVTANDFIDQLKELGDVETINLRIASGGGSIVEGNTIFNALQRHSAKVVTHIDSLAASMASVIAMAGDEIRMAENALLMIHNPWTMSMGGAEQLRKDADLLDKMEANIRTSYARSNLSAEELDAAMEAETYYTAAEALELGFIDAIDGANLAAASIGDMETVAEFNKLPQAKLDSIKIECQAKQIESLSVRLEEALGELECRDETIESTKGLLAKADEEIASIKAQAEAEKEKHADALVAATEQTAQQIADKAAELLAESGSPALELNASNDASNASAQKMTEKEFWEQYREFDNRGDLEGKNEFYTEHKHVIGQ